MGRQVAKALTDATNCVGEAGQTARAKPLSQMRGEAGEKRVRGIEVDI
jgi:hypothetical protein